MRGRRRAGAAEGAEDDVEDLEDAAERDEAALGAVRVVMRVVRGPADSETDTAATMGREGAKEAAECALGVQRF